MGKIGDLCEIKEEMEFQWKIENFYELSQEIEIDTCYESSKFYFSGTSWELWIYPNGETKYNTRGRIGLYLVRMSTGSPVTVDFSLGLIAVGGKTEFNVTDEYEYVFNKSNGRYGWYKFISRSALIERKAKLCPSDVLTVICTLKSSKRNADPESYINRLQNVSDNLKEMYQTGKKTDFTLNVNGEIIRAHRMILETRCPVFAAMLNHDTLENQTGEVTIDDLDKSAMDDILVYIYSGDIDKLTTENALSLYAAADKYDIKDVKKMCVKFILSNLSVEWLCDIIKFASLYNEEEIARRTREYFKGNAGAILHSDKWKSFVKENSDIALSFLTLF